MFDAQTLSIVFAGLSIGLAAIYYTFTSRARPATFIQYNF